MIYGNDTLKIISSTGGYTDLNGDWNEGTKQVSNPIQCDAQPNGRADTITLPDGSSYKYSYEITLDISQPEIPYGTKIILTCRGKQPQELIVRGFHTYSFQTKLWV